MILKQNIYFEGFIIIEMIEKSSTYREVYRAKDLYDNYCDIIVYDLKSLPECYVAEIIPEFNMLMRPSADCLPKYINGGRYEVDDLCIAWMAVERTDASPLSGSLKMIVDSDVDVVLHQFRKLLINVDKLSIALDGSCHNNINCDTIKVSEGKDGLPEFHLSGLECVSSSCQNNPTFDTDIQSKFFRAPETLLGRYNITTDIFSLGVVLAICLQGKHPWQSVIDENKDVTLKGFIKSIRQQEPVLDIPEEIKYIVQKAIAVKPSSRFSSIEEFCMLIEDYLGIDISEHYTVEKFYLTHENKKAEENEKENEEDCDDDEDESYDPFKQQAPSQPEINLKIERVKGDGFKDVAGMSHLKSMLTRNFIDIFKNAELARQYKITPPNGMLLWGPPGNGKTFISRKLAEECGMMYCMVKPSDLGNIYIHGSQKLIADLFKRCEKTAKKNKCGVLLVFDEFDALVPRRDKNDKNDNQADEVAEFLTQLNNCAERKIFVVAMTNRIDAIDPAVLRKGRIDQAIYVDLPDNEARKELFNIELNDIPHDDIDMERIVQLTMGFCASDITFIVKECSRCTFQESVKTKHIVKISQERLEKIISSTNPSVSHDEIRHYEKLRESFERGRNNDRPKIGFNV